jgi:hypothetical protein
LHTHTHTHKQALTRTQTHKRERQVDTILGSKVQRSVALAQGILSIDLGVCRKQEVDTFNAALQTRLHETGHMLA